MMSLQKIEKIVMYKSNLSYPFGYHNANKAQKIHQILKINSIINTVYQVFSRASIFRYVRENIKVVKNAFA